MVSSTPGAGTDHGCNSAEGVGEGLFETVRLSFFSVPPFIDFNVDDQVDVRPQVEWSFSER